MDDTPVSAPAPPPRRRLRPLAWILAKDRPWLNALLFGLTALSAYLVGVSWSASYKYAEALARDPGFRAPAGIFRDPEIVGLSLLYAAALLAVLLGHELGHYLTCRRYGIRATLPFFIPAPTLVGTMGAFIRIRTPITRKRELFDIGAAGPLTGFLLALPALAIGISLSKVVPALPREGAILFGEPLILKILGGLLIEGAGPGFDVVLHPVAFAGWVGMLVTSLNLFPLGQLDGGHVAYAVLGRHSRAVSRAVLALFLVLGVLYWAGWIIWFFLVLILGLKHPRVFDEAAPLGRGRVLLGLAILAIFVLTFIPEPIKGYNIRVLWQALKP